MDSVYWGNLAAAGKPRQVVDLIRLGVVTESNVQVRMYHEHLRALDDEEFLVELYTLDMYVVVCVFGRLHLLTMTTLPEPFVTLCTRHTPSPTMASHVSGSCKASLAPIFLPSDPAFRSKEVDQGSGWTELVGKSNKAMID